MSVIYLQNYSAFDRKTTRFTVSKTVKLRHFYNSVVKYQFTRTEAVRAVIWLH